MKVFYATGNVSVTTFRENEKICGLVRLSRFPSAVDFVTSGERKENTSVVPRYLLPLEKTHPFIQSGIVLIVFINKLNVINLNNGFNLWFKVNIKFQIRYPTPPIRFKWKGEARRCERRLRARPRG